MCGEICYDRKHGVPNIADEYTISVRLEMYYSYQKYRKDGETENEYYKRKGWKRK